jgi:hypothetical protein
LPPAEWFGCGAPRHGQTDGHQNSQVAVVIGPQADQLERQAAHELCRYLDKLFGIKARPTTELHPSAETLLLVGNPNSNPAVAAAMGEDWPELTDQGIVLKRLDSEAPTLVVGGGSAVATMWAVYELVERWGVRYLVDRDIVPAERTWRGLPDLDVVMQPNMRIRCWRLVNDLAFGPVSWSLEENRRFLHQIAKMKYNRIHVAVYPFQPFVHYSFRGMEKPPGALYYQEKYPIDDDTIGREKFGERQFFYNPNLAGAESPARECACSSCPNC